MRRRTWRGRRSPINDACHPSAGPWPVVACRVISAARRRTLQPVPAWHDPARRRRMHWHARSRRLSRPRRATPAGQDAVGDRADRVLSPPPVPGTTTSAWALRRVFAGRADQVRHARRFVKVALDECPVADLVVLLSDELVTNSDELVTNAVVFSLLCFRVAIAA